MPHIQPMLTPDPRPNWPQTFRRAGIITLVGLPGVVSLLLILPPMPGVNRLELLVNPAVLLIAFAWVGARLAPRAGFRSALADGDLRPAVLRGLARPLVLGVGAGMAVALLDHLTAPVWRPPGLPTLVEGWSPAQTVAGLLYGGLTEEIVMRWGLLSLIVWGIWRLAARQSLPAPAPMLWFGILLSAVFFAAGHVPALVALTPEPGLGLVARTLVSNTSLGILFGWLFVRRDLESAMAAHMGCHLGFALAAMSARAIGI